jgi:hypothetical protein
MNMETAIIEITPLLRAAKALFREIVSIENVMLTQRAGLLEKAWQLGILLNELKEEIGHGKWLLWLEGNFKELGKTAEMREKNAQRCMKFARENPNPRNSSVLVREGFPIIPSSPREFDGESKRKFMWNYIPEKERPEFEGNRKLKPLAHYLSFINHFAKFDRQVRVGLIPMPPLDLFRQECEPTMRRIIEIGGREWMLSLL